MRCGGSRFAAVAALAAAVCSSGCAKNIKTTETIAQPRIAGSMQIPPSPVIVAVHPPVPTAPAAAVTAPPTVAAASPMHATPHAAAPAAKPAMPAPPAPPQRPPAELGVGERGALTLSDGSGDIPIKESQEPPLLNLVEPTPQDAAVLKTIYFGYDKSNLRSEQRRVLEGIARWMAKSNQTLLIEGHCDERGTDEYNISLGERRALEIRHQLDLLGVDTDRLSTISYGEEKPAVRGSNEAAWSKNRRAEFRILAP